MPSVTAMGMISSAALTRMRIVMAGEKNEGQNERLEPQSCGRVNERASGKIWRWMVLVVGIGGGEKASGLKGVVEKRETSRSPSAIRGAVPVPSHVQVPGAWGACTPGTRPVRARTAV